MLFITILILILVNAQQVSEAEFDKEPICGDGIWDSFTEQCDGSNGCGKDCVCKKGYTPDKKGNCIMSCMFGKNCINGCTKPDVCMLCDEKNGYTRDCTGCQPGYMWFGEGNCSIYDASNIQGCRKFIDESNNLTTELGLSENPFIINLDQKRVDNKPLSYKVIIPELPVERRKLQLTLCSRFVDPTRPYTYGVWVQLNSDKGAKVNIEINKRYTVDDINLADAQQTKIGTELVLATTEKCLPSFSEKESRECLYRNGGISEYIRNPRLTAIINPKVPYYVFIHSRYASMTIPSFTLYISDTHHSCSSTSFTISWNSIISPNGFRGSYNLENAVISRNICNPSTNKGFWFMIEGSDQIIDISTCDSGAFDVTLDFIEAKLSDYGLVEGSLDNISIDCNSAPTKCLATRTYGCGENSRLARLIQKLDHEHLYFLYLEINEEYAATINLTIKTTCPHDCGEHGICSTSSGQCECIDGYILNDRVCTLCGNGKLDKDEECDPSVEGYNDSRCTDACACRYGTQPMEIDGVVKCAVPTCGNGQVDDFEECDGGYGCDHCVCVNGTKKYAKARAGCILATCGNRKWDEGEECDGGDGCIECECQPDWYTQDKAHCKNVSKSLTNFFFWGIGSIVYVLYYIFTLILFLLLYIRLTRKIKQEIDDEKLIIFENTIIPFDKTNSQYIDLKQENPYFSFSTNTIDFGDIRPEIDEPIDYPLTLTNNWKYPMHFTFHSGDYTKYEIMCKPFTGTIRPKESVDLSISFMAKCTALLNEKVPITIRYGQLQNVLKDIKKENPELIAHCSQSSQNSESEGKSQTSGTNGSNSIKKSHISKSTPSGSGKSGSSHESDSKKKGKSKVSKFHVYLNLQVESALSTKLDYEEIHLQHPPIGGGTFGIVYRAEWRGVDVAVKVMKTDLVGLGELLPNFMQEAEMMERIRCPYIVNFIGSVVTADTLCLVTEFCPLGSLRKFMKTNPMSDLLKVRFCQDIARGMEYLHQNDILHRDLKTDNVLVYSKNPHDPITAKVTDFGTSRSFIESSNTIALQNIGTPVYMAPEISRKDQMTLKSDVYSFAICMLEIWLGRDPYDPMKFPDSESILRFVGAGKRLHVSTDCILKGIIEKAWNHKPSDRPTFKELGTELEAIYKKTSDKSKSDSHNKNHSESTKTNTKSKDISSSEIKLTTNTTTNTVEDQGESIEASASSQMVDNN
ncbi:protein tyrosine kinase domain-containing protein [Entamoeba histolytica]|uniref:Protein tyrosine kinase domain-containing protein n=5 Tax=Entamoeba histolytica TaxID=5759 RepID=C4M6Q6_ENTH1|nr:protein tyrosine kinase domain-containing protein [Entamoeba histolytica HM-1:IMSS]EAL46614.1 protein tyrosine kinase domain-containing protein [Entamoeba histolytica HM-1:IMSS]GAT97178.1 protein tyrosine kinase domain-containing protein [Entamoeba histolytica]|eukprot:XP_652001.1 protein tyrosine kinase domain-containing protein [Entamoeba histolytica HM-1:IMSS]